MNYSIKTIPKFDKNLKKLVKKHASFKEDFISFVNNLKSNPIQGIDLGNNCYKIRLAIKSKGKGKSGGARIITNIVISKSTVYLIAIYDKTEKVTLSKKELQDLLKDIPTL